MPYVIDQNRKLATNLLQQQREVVVRLMFGRALTLSIVAAAWPGSGQIAHSLESATAAAGGQGGSAAFQAPGKAPGQGSPDQTSPELAGVTVTANERCFHPQAGGDGSSPHVVSTYPEQNAVVSPGLVVIRITFDQEMACGWSVIRLPGNDVPPCGRFIILIPGRKVFKIECRLSPKTDYELWLNYGKSMYFANIWGRRLKPYDYRFSTNASPPVKTLGQALSADPTY